MRCHDSWPPIIPSFFQVGIACSYGLWAVSSNFLIFVIARFVGGLSKGNISLSMAIITDVSDEKNRNRGMALVGIAFSLGFIFGPMIGAIFSVWSDKTSTQWYCYPALFAMLLAIGDVIFISICLKETLPKVGLLCSDNLISAKIEIHRKLSNVKWNFRKNVRNKWSIRYRVL